eukprot:CAMPEP_0119332876 /NCGR_PEP_ID=MMETSP1333-20130426/83811_1 /TAXON_ID=418940 /ORGANISM="Scyphosphaera apsteinii, Strain RCC1455" /LENGTH=652 /DNA_ID=CAMNT_0007342791 /DNA_START=3 /DNA_END=1961 /DNA_ORIENTATION=+
MKEDVGCSGRQQLKCGGLNSKVFVEVQQAVLAELKRTASPLDKQQLTDSLNQTLSLAITVKDVNKCLYVMATTGDIVQAEEMHNNMPTWLSPAVTAADEGVVSSPESVEAEHQENLHAAKAMVVGAPDKVAEDADDSDSEENRPLRDRRKQKKFFKRARNNDTQRNNHVAQEPEPVDPELAVTMAHAVLAASKAGDHEAVLSVLGVAVTYNSPYSLQRKAYLGLARLIHPDKLSSCFPGASTAFQALVKAFEALTTPDMAEPTQSGKGKKKAPKPLPRSNENCFRTRVRCPRCQANWGTADSGLQPYEYSFLMQGLKSYICCGCLFSFGCMSARHYCPLCQEEIDYHPSQFHSQVLCASCDKVFGFKLYSVGPRIEANLRADVLARQQQRHQQRTAQASRKEARVHMGPRLTDEQQRRQAEQAFVIGLRDDCPRCGRRSASEIGNANDADEKKRRMHLRDCTDTADHEAWQKKQQKKSAGRELRAERLKADEEEGNVAAWRLLGSTAESVWLLTDTQLHKQCEEHGIRTEGSREEQLARLSAALNSEGGPLQLTAESTPANLHAMSLTQLRSVCAAHGLVPPENSGVQELISLLESRSDAYTAIEGGLDGDKSMRLCNGMSNEGDDDDGEADVADDDETETGEESEEEGLDE